VIGISATPIPSPEQLDLAQQVAQMVVVRASGHLFDHEIRYPAWEANAATLSHYVQELGVGGVILLGGSAAEVGLKTQQLQTQATWPLLVAADVEEGVGQRFSGATWFPPPLALGAIAATDFNLALDYAQALGTATAQEALAIGLNWVLAPVVDINNNPQNPVINVRAFGQTPAQVAALSRAFIQGAKGQGVLTTAKHFPGHGDTEVDSHLQLPVLAHDRDRLERLELVPFTAAIAAQVDAVMTAHLSIPALDQHHPSTLSAPTLTGLLRQHMGFEGLIVTDALVMGAISQTYGPYEAAVLAIEAGADILLMPADPEGVIRAVTEAVTIGRLGRDRIATSLERIWRAKQRLASRLTIPPESCHAWEHVPPPPVQLEALGQPATQQLAADILQSSMVVDGTIPPCTAAAPGNNLVIVDDVVDCRFLSRTAAAITLPQAHHYRLTLIDHQGCHQWPQPSTLVPTLVQVFIRGNPFRGSATATRLAEAWLQALHQAQHLRGVVIYGSPYALEQFRPWLDPDIPYGFTYGQMPLAQSLVLKTLMPTLATSHPNRKDFTD
jgi:beta-glucosidase